MKELKKYGLRSSRRPMSHPLLSGVAILVTPEGKTLHNIRFAECFVDAVGRALPFGLSPERPAFLKVMHMGRLWRVFAMYLPDDRRGAILWESAQPPPWLSPPVTD